MKASRLIIIDCFVPFGDPLSGRLRTAALRCALTALLAPLKILFLTGLAMTILVSPLQASPEEAVSKVRDNENEFTVGVITISPPEKYAVVEEAKTKKRRLYKITDYEKLDKKGLKFLESILINTIEYRYRPVSGKTEFISDQFELVNFKSGKATLKKDYLEKPEELIEKDEAPIIIEEAEEIKEAQKDTEESAKKETTAKRLVAELFFKIKSKQISEHEWEISLPTILAAASNFENVLGIVIKKINGLIEPEKKSKIYFKTSIGKGTLGPDGLLVESLNSRIKAKCGIKDGDLIQSVSAKRITTIEDVASLSSSFTGSPQTLTIKLTRDDAELTLTYYIK